MKVFLKIFFCLFLVNLFSINFTFSQCPSNLSFDANNLSFWTFKTGSFAGFNASSPDYGATYTTANTFNPVPANVSTLIYIPSSVPTTANGVRVIKAKPDNTPIYDSIVSSGGIYNVIKQVPNINGYQYSYSVKLGNNSTGRGAEQLVYRFKVPETNPNGSTLTTYNITYAYALILEAAGHGENDQPRFNATVNDLSQPTSSQKIECASKQYFVPTLNNDPTWINGGSMMYKNWQEVSFDVSQYAGKMIEIKFSVVDCSFGGHSGYAYVALRNDGCGAGTIVGQTSRSGGC